MIRLFAILLTLSLLFNGCSNPMPPNSNDPLVKYGDFGIKIIDSCEYIEYDYGLASNRVYSLTHKGNCKFCQKRKTTTP